MATETQSANGQTGTQQAGRRPQEEGTERKRKPSTVLNDLWTSALEARKGLINLKRKAMLCTATVRDRNRLADILSAADADVRTVNDFAAEIRTRATRIHGELAEGIASMKGVNIVVGGRLMDGVALANALRRDEDVILSADHSAE